MLIPSERKLYSTCTCPPWILLRMFCQKCSCLTMAHHSLVLSFRKLSAEVLFVICPHFSLSFNFQQIPRESCSVIQICFEKYVYRTNSGQDCQIPPLPTPDTHYHCRQCPSKTFGWLVPLFTIRCHEILSVQDCSTTSLQKQIC